MITPLQSSAGTVTTTLMQSMIDQAEEKRAEDEKKARRETKEDDILKARISASKSHAALNEKVNAHFFNTGALDVNEMKLRLVESLGKMLGIEKQEGQSGYSYGVQLEKAIAQLDPQEKFALTDKLGLAELGISLDDLVKAIKNPYGKEDDKLEIALEERATGVSGTTSSRTKVLQRMETIADPKTLEELKLERAGETSDPTKVEDAETKAEREEQIGALEAGEKLEDVKDLHEAVKKQNEQAIGNGKTEGAAEDAVVAAVETIQVLAAGGEAIRDIQDTADASEGVATQIADRGPESANGKNDISLSEQEEVYLISSNGPDMTEVTGPSILPIEVDKNGIYALLAKTEKQAA